MGADKLEMKTFDLNHQRGLKEGLTRLPPTLSNERPRCCGGPRRAVERAPRYARLKKMIILVKRYYWIVIPVHVLTEVAWIGLFYALLQRDTKWGPLMRVFIRDEEAIEKIEKMIRSKTAVWSIIFILIKLMAPVRYAFTIAITSLLVRFLARRGYVQPLEPFRRAATRLARRHHDTPPSKKTTKTRSVAALQEKQKFK